MRTVIHSFHQHTFYHPLLLLHMMSPYSLHMKPYNIYNMRFYYCNNYVQNVSANYVNGLRKRVQNSIKYFRQKKIVGGNLRERINIFEMLEHRQKGYHWCQTFKTKTRKFLILSIWNHHMRLTTICGLICK